MCSLMNIPMDIHGFQYLYILMDFITNNLPKTHVSNPNPHLSSIYISTQYLTSFSKSMYLNIKSIFLILPGSFAVFLVSGNSPPSTHVLKPET